ncbi:MAG: hypothetical protein NVS3B21_03300 [Acidimicrobiales bacterium]
MTKWFEQRVYRSATTIVAHSQWAANSVISYGIEPSRIRIVRFGVPMGAEADRTIAEQPPQITFIGRQLERKGGLRLLKLHQRHLVGKCILNVVSPEKVRPLPGVRSFDDIRPADPRLAEILRASAAMVFPSPIDQAPNVVLEAMAQGVAVVGFRVGAVPEMVDDGVTGVLVEPDDDRALLRAIEGLLNDLPQARAMGHRARERADLVYNVERSTAQLIEILHEAVAQHEASGRR